MSEARPWGRWPRQRRLLDEEGYLFHGKYCSPELAKLADGLGLAISVAGVFGGIILAVSVGEWYPVGYGFTFFVINVILYRVGLYRPVIVLFLGRRFRVVIAKNRVRIGTWHGYKDYSAFPVTFEIGTHPNAAQEREQMELTRKRVKEYYGKSFQIVMWYGDQRVVIASIYKNQNKAEGLVSRLNFYLQEVQQAFGV